MRSLLTKTLIALVAVACCRTNAQAGWGGVRIGIGVGFPYPYYGPYYRPYYYGYPYYAPAVVVAPAPATVVVQPAPAAAQPAPAGSAYPPPAQTAPPPTLPAPTPLSAAPTSQPATLSTVVASSASETPADTQRLLEMLRDPGEGARVSAVMQLGRSKVQQAVEPLSRTLSGDSSARVREAAARALGLIAAPSSLNALQTAAQADDDREVRHSAQFAAEVIRGNLRR